MHKGFKILIVILVVVLGLAVWQKLKHSPEVTPPDQTQNQENEFIRVTTPQANAVVDPTKSLVVLGEAKGTWFFEAVFQARIEDANGKIVTEGHAEALGDWMTEDFVSFQALLKFTEIPSTTTGTLVLEEDNPSGKPNPQQLRIPIRFK